MTNPLLPKGAPMYAGSSGLCVSGAPDGSERVRRDDDGRL